MAKRTPPTHPRVQRQIEALGQRLRAARLRRSMTQEVMAERVGVSVPTIAKLESGEPSTSLATMLRVLTALGLTDDIDLIATQDQLGRELQDNALRRGNARPRKPTPLIVCRFASTTRRLAARRASASCRKRPVAAETPSASSTTAIGWPVPCRWRSSLWITNFTSALARNTHGWARTRCRAPFRTAPPIAGASA